MRIGIFFNSMPHFGGVFQYSHTLVSALAEGEWRGDQLIVFSGVRSEQIEALLRKNGVPFVYMGPLRLGLEAMRRPSIPVLIQAARFIRMRMLHRASDAALHQIYLDLTRKVVERHKVDLMIYSRIDFETFHNRIPFVAAIHDLQHRFNPQFPEVSANDLWAWREYFFHNGAKNALALFVDSKIGKQDVIDCYGTPADRVKVLPFLPPDYLREDVDPALLKETREKFSLPRKYLFYPAQFWAHKNHRRIVGALARIKREHGLEIPVVFCGGEMREHGEFDRVMRLARDLGIADQVYYLGYIDDRYLAPLYAMALALVMPTFFGPTNIPILEAWKMGCPVITSDIRGCRDQAGDAALLVKPDDEADIAGAIYRIYSDAALRQRLVKSGRKRLMQWTAKDFKRQVRETIDYCRAELEPGKRSGWELISFDEARKRRPAIVYDQEVAPVACPKPGKRYPRISVITPSYNSSQYIEQAIQSVLRQNYPNFEHIVIDAGSTDGTVGILKRYPHVRWISKKDRGQSDAMNKGFLISSGDVIVYLNADDFFEPGAFFDAVEHLDREKGVFVVAGMCNVAKPDGSVYVPAFVPKTDFFHMMFWWNAWFPINPTSYFYFRDVQEAVGGYDMKDHYLMDYDFLLKVSLRYRIRIVEHVWGNFRWLETNKSATRPAELTRQIVSRKYFRRLSAVEKAGYYRHYWNHRLGANGPKTSLAARSVKKLLSFPAHGS